MSTRVSVGKHVGNGVYVGTSTSLPRIQGGPLIFGIILLPGLLWVITGLGILKDIAINLLGGNRPMDVVDAKVNLITFAITVAEVLVFVILTH